MNGFSSPRSQRLRQRSFWFGLAALSSACVGAVWQPQRALVSCLFAFVFWTGLGLGCLAVTMIHHLTAGRWGYVSRRLLEAGFLTLPWCGLFLLPILAGLKELYPWARTGRDALGGAPLPLHSSYLNVPGFVVRSIVFLFLWVAAARVLRRWSLQQDATRDPGPTLRLRMLSGPGLIGYAFTGTLAFIDWVMSTEPSWYSTMFPVIVLIGQILSCLAALILGLAWVRDQEPFAPVVNARHFHDLGNLLLTFVMFWTYVSFSQFLIQYSGNLPREIDWYRHRSTGGWSVFVWGLALFHFFLPFGVLLFRGTKRHPIALAWVAGVVFLAQAAAVFWMIVPAFAPQQVSIHWLDAAAFAGLGGLWVARFVDQLQKAPALPQNDPRQVDTLKEWSHAQ